MVVGPGRPVHSRWSNQSVSDDGDRFCDSSRRLATNPPETKWWFASWRPFVRHFRYLTVAPQRATRILSDPLILQTVVLHPRGDR